MQSILLVEDNLDDVELTLRVLHANHIANKVDVARDGAEALEILKATDAPLPSLVLLDLNLPKLNGLEVLRWIRAQERTHTLPVVILATSREEEDIAAGYGLGANSYVRKPVDFDDFSEAIRQVGLYWLILNIAPTNNG